MTTTEQAFIGLALFAGVMTILIVLDAVVTWLAGPDKDLERPWRVDE